MRQRDNRLGIALIAMLCAEATHAATAVHPVRVNRLHAQSAQTVTSSAGAADPRAEEMAARLRGVLGRRADQRRAAQTHGRAAFEALRQSIEGELQVRWRDDAGTPRQIRAASLARAAGGGEVTARSFLRLHRELLRLDDPDAELRLERRQQDALGREHLRFAQRYRQLPVWPAELIVHLTSGGDIDLVDGAYVPTPRRLDTQPAIAAQAAIEAARAGIPGAASAASSQPELIIYAPGGRAARLAWRLRLSASLRARWLAVVDARSGQLLNSFSEIMDENVTGSGTDANGDVQGLNVWHEGGSFYLVDTSKPMYDPSSDPPDPTTTRGGIIVLDADNLPPNSSPEEIPDLFFVSAANATGWQVPDGVSAAVGLAHVYDYYRMRHGRNSFDDAGSTMLGAVRLGAGFHNAFWNGTQMFFGDGENYAGSFDVVAHELTHAVTQYTANLVYRDQPGALNESFSDIFGAAAEAFVFGETDWLHGSQLSAPDRSLADPGSIAICAGCPGYPARMSEFLGADDTTLDRFVDRDQGGVHINSSIPNHAFYLLAEGLDGAIGIGKAEQIFYRALSQHLMANSQFVDARLACVAAAREIFGAGSEEEQRTGAAFDAVEIFAGRGTPPPQPFPGVNGADATLFLFWDPDLETYFLGRREEALGDPPEGVKLIDRAVAATRAAVAGDGSFAVFVDADRDVCFVNTDGTPFDPEGDTVEQCLGFPGFVSTVAVAPDGGRFGFVLLDTDGNPDNRISVIDPGPPGGTRTFTLRAPVFDGTVTDSVLNAGTMDFTADGGFLVYEALNRIRLVDGSRVDAWSIYALDLGSETTLALVPPVPGLDIANPALSQTSDNFLVFDVYDAERGDSTMLATDLTAGTAGEIGTVSGGLGVPGYSGDDGAIIYSQSSDTPTAFSLVRQRLSGDRLTPQGAPQPWLANADFGVIYRRGRFVGPDVCAGDCNADGEVAIEDLIKSVSIALGAADPSTCLAIDLNADQSVSVDELVRAVNAALDGCPG
jgi:bacillolysin